MTSPASWRRDTVLVAAGRPPHEPGAPVNHGIGMSTTFVLGGERGYLREGSTGTGALEAALGALDGGEAIAFASGMAATAAVLDGLPVGSIVVAPTSMYWGSVDLLRVAQQLGRLIVRSVDITDTAAVEAAAAGAALVWIETATNPLLTVADVPTICAAAHAAGALTCVDATFATPLRQRPIEQGADIVMHSATKFISGHSDLLLGMLITADPTRAEALREQRHRTGATPGALETYLALRGLRTLDVRLDRQEANAVTLAQRLSEHPAVQRVRYPGLHGDPGFSLAAELMDGPGSVMAFDLADADAADAVCAGVTLITHATSLGGVESLIERRAAYPGERSIGTPDGLVRLSVGIEHVEDLWADLKEALDGIGRRTGAR